MSIILIMQNINENFDSMICENTEKYSGKWVAILNKRIVAVGNSFREVFNFVKKKYPNDRPLIGRIPESVPVVFNLK